MNSPKGVGRDIVPPQDVVLMAHGLTADLDEYLSTVQQVTTAGDENTLAELARAELPHLVAAIRTLLGQHHPDSHNRCPTCRPRRWWFPHRSPNMPCRAYLAAHRRLVVLTDSASPRPGRGSAVRPSVLPVGGLSSTTAAG